MTYDRIKSCYHFVEGECPHQRFLHIVCLFPQLLGRVKPAKYHKALLDCLYCGQFINRRPSQNLAKVETPATKERVAKFWL